MRRTFLFIAVTACLLVLGIAGCVNTTLKTDWRDPGFQGTFKKVFVICLAKEQIVRDTLEDDIAAQFSAKGVTALPSYNYFPSMRGVNRQTVIGKVRELKADGIFLVRPVGQGSRTVSFEDGDQFDTYQSNTIDIYRVETTLYETSKGKMVWQALSDTMAAGSWLETLKEFAKIMVAKLSERGLI